jgi:hypothetical protein
MRADPNSAWTEVGYIGAFARRVRRAAGAGECPLPHAAERKPPATSDLAMRGEVARKPPAASGAGELQPPPKNQK